MPTFDADGVNIHYEVSGSGLPLVLSHEFAGDGASWEPQVNFFSRRYQVVTYSARGYLPSDVPEDPAAYSQDRSTEDLRLPDGPPGYRAGLYWGLVDGRIGYRQLCHSPSGKVPGPDRGRGGRRGR